MGGRGRVKRQQVDTEDGWTVITHGLSKLSVGGHGGKKEKGKGGKSNAHAGSMPELVQGLTAEKLLLDFENRTEKWKTTACAQQLGSLLGKREWGVETAVCIGIGSFSRDWEHRHRAMWQLVLFMAVVKHLRDSNAEVKLYAQEPAFTPIDHEFLALLSIHVCTDGIAAHITPRSFVFSPFVDWHLLLPVFLKGKDPVLYVGNEILDDYTAFAQSEDKRAKLEECNGLGRKWVGKRDVAKMGDLELHPHALNGMVVYWLVESEENEEVVSSGQEKNAGEDSTTTEHGQSIGAATCP